MSILKLSKNNYKQEIPFLLICLLMLFPLLEVRMVSKISTLFFVLSLVLNFKSGFQTFYYANKKHLIVNVLFYIVLIGSIAYSFDKQVATKTVLRQISFFLFPFIIFYFLKLSRQKLILLAKIFVLANVLSAFYLYTYIIVNESISEIIYGNFDFRSVVTSNTTKDWHPTYIGIYTLTSVLLLIEYCYYKKQRLLVPILFTIILTSLIFIINSRTVVYAFLFIIPVYIFLKTKSRAGRRLFFVISIPLALAFYYLLSHNFSFNYRLVLQLKKLYAWFFTTNLNTIGIDVRYFITQCNLELFKTEPILGYGIGDIRYNLQSCYLDKEYLKLYNQYLNPHNNYFFLLLSGGLVALFSFLYLLVNNFYMAFKRKNMLFIGIMLILLSVSLTEVIFVRLTGIVFFAISNTLLYYDMLNYQKTK